MQNIIYKNPCDFAFTKNSKEDLPVCSLSQYNPQCTHSTLSLLQLEGGTRGSRF